MQQSTIRRLKISITVAVLAVGLSAGAVKLFHKEHYVNWVLARLGSASSQYWLGYHYDNHSLNRAQACFWYREASKSGYKEAAASYCGCLLEEKESSKKDMAWYRWASMEECKEPFMINEMASDCFRPDKILNSDQTGFDRKECLEWLEHAAKLAEEKKMYSFEIGQLSQLGEFFLYGRYAPDIVRDHQKALKYFERAQTVYEAHKSELSSDNWSVWHMGLLGTILMYGKDGVPKDEKRGFSFLSEALDKQPIFSDELIKAYFSGRGTEVDIEKARQIKSRPLLPDDEDPADEDSIFNFPRKEGFEMYKCYLPSNTIQKNPAVIFRKEKDTYTVKRKEYEPSRVIVSLKVTEKEWLGLKEAVEKSDFYNLMSNNGEMGLDGYSFHVSGVKEGKLQILYRWVNGKDIYPVCDYLYGLIGYNSYRPKPGI